MTSHEFAKQLLEGPNLPIRVPRVVEYDNEEGALEIPVIAQEVAIKDEDEYEEFEVLIISQNVKDEGRRTLDLANTTDQL